jgi:hypothetical protein
MAANAIGGIENNKSPSSHSTVMNFVRFLPQRGHDWRGLDVTRLTGVGSHAGCTRNLRLTVPPYAL